MYVAAFRDGLAKAGELTPAQRQPAIEGLRQARRSGPDPLAAVLDVSRTCPHGHHPVCRPWGQAQGLPRWRCAACGKTCNALTGTPLARLRHRERWGEYAQALIDGETVRAAARRGGVHQNTSFRWRHRCLALPAEVKPTHRHGIVAAVTAVLGPLVDPDAVLCSDSAAIYRRFAETAHMAHTAVNLSAGIRVIDHAFHLQNVNADHGRLQGWMARFHGVATHYPTTSAGGASWSASARPSRRHWCWIWPSPGANI